MKLSDYLKTREGALKENQVSRLSILFLTILCLILAFGMARKSTTVVMVPPNLAGKVEVSTDRADKEMQVTWGVFVTTLLGNVTPRSAPHLKTLIGPHLSSRIYNKVIEGIDKQAKDVIDEQLTLSFTPTGARYDDDIQKVVVSGELTIRGLRGQEKRELRSYEMGFVVRNYQVLLDTMRVCQGPCKREREENE